MPVTMPYQPLFIDVRHAIREDGASPGDPASRKSRAVTPDIRQSRRFARTG
jgi:hypothetical protein